MGMGIVKVINPKVVKCDITESGIKVFYQDRTASVFLGWSQG